MIGLSTEAIRERKVARTLKIFISSPGDVIPERELARKVIGELNEEMMGKVFVARCFPPECTADVRGMIENDLAYEVFVQKGLVAAVAICEQESDFVSRQVLLKLLDDTETDHIHWCEKQLGLIDKMGLQNYTQSQMS